MNKIEQYLNSIKPKELIYIFLSIPIIIFIVYYNFIYPNLNEQNIKLTKELKKSKSTLSKTALKIRELKKINNSLPSVTKKLEKSKENLKYIKYAIAYLDLIKLDENKIYANLKKILDQANTLSLSASLSIKWNQKYPPYQTAITLNIKGNGNFIDIIHFIQYLEALNNVVLVQNVKIGKQTPNIPKSSYTQPFSITLTIVGEK